MIGDMHCFFFSYLNYQCKEWIKYLLLVLGLELKIYKDLPILQAFSDYFKALVFLHHTVKYTKFLQRNRGRINQSVH